MSDSAPNTNALDPLLTFFVHDDAAPLPTSADSSGFVAQGKRSTVTGVCLLGAAVPSVNVSETDHHEEQPQLQFKSAHLLQSAYDRNNATAASRALSDRLLLQCRRLVSCHGDGTCLIWDLKSQTMVHEVSPKRGPGVCVRRVDNVNDQFLFQTRDQEGTVSLHDGDNGVAIAQFASQSQTFCAVAPCWGNSHLVASPSKSSGSGGSMVVVRDWRSPSHRPVATITVGSASDQMMTSLSMVQGPGGDTILGCGMDSGMLYFYDLRSCQMVSSMRLGNEPVLDTDMVPSMGSETTRASFLAVAGLAGKRDDLSDMPKNERGRLAVVKLSSIKDGPYQSRIRKRLSTINESKPGNPGVALCRFRPDGRLFAVGGWDRRVRIYDRVGYPVAILRGHAETISAMDWAMDADVSGLMATGSADGKIHIWKCLPKKNPTKT